MSIARVIPNEDIAPPPPGDWPAAPGRNGNGTRYTEHADPTVEAQLISAALTAPGVVDAAVATGLTVDHFTAEHQALWGAIVAVTEHGARPDPGLVLDAARSAHAPINEHELMELAASPAGYLSNVATYAAVIIGHAHSRRARSALADASEAIQRGADPHAVLAGLSDALPAAATTTEGLFEDMARAIEGGKAGDPPSVGIRDDGACAFWYRGKLNSCIGESESGKSWLLQRDCVQEIGKGNHVIYLDYEKDAAAVAERLLLMGADEAAMIEFFHYRRVEDPLTLAERMALREACRTMGVTLAVIDGVTNAMQLEGLKIESNNDVSKFNAGVPAAMRVEGAAVVEIDHTPKNPENQSKGAIGGQHKRAGIDGATIRMVMREMPGRNRTGTGYLAVDKDAPGWLREHAVDGRIIGDITIHSDGDSTTVRVVPSSKKEGGKSADGAPRLTGYMERVSRVLEGFGDDGQSGRTLAKVVTGDDKYVYAALKTLVAEGWVKVTKVGSSNLHTVAKPYREAMDRTLDGKATSDAEDLRVDDEPADDERGGWGDQPF